MKRQEHTLAGIVTSILVVCAATAFSQQQKTHHMTLTDFTTTILVNETPEAVYNAINNVRGWWSEEVEGNTDKLNGVFNYHFEDIHRCKVKIVELVPGKKVVWEVLENYFKFTKDKSEWTGTKIIFDISTKDNKTQVRFTHLGLVPEYECFEVCREGWGNYINNSLYKLISTGKGQPNATGKPQTESEKQIRQTNNKTMNQPDYTATLTVDATPQEVFKNINSVTKWWTADLTGSSQKLNEAFTVRFGDVHVSTQKIVEVIPDKKVVWLVTDSKLNFIKDKQEWTNTKISFEISSVGNKTQVRFTHHGLVPDVECFKDCTKGWDYYIKGSLFKLLTEGKGEPGLMKN